MSEKVEIYTYPAAILLREADPVENIDEELQKLIDNMSETMYAAPGIGLAANQVGVAKKLLVYDVTSKEGNRNLSVLINPEIILSEGEIIHDEACLSVLDFSAPIRRSSRIKVKGVDRHGKPVDIEAEGLLAVCLQHEIDHLNGKLILDHVSGLKRSLYRKKLKKILENR